MVERRKTKKGWKYRAVVYGDDKRRIYGAWTFLLSTAKQDEQTLFKKRTLGVPITREYEACTVENLFVKFHKATRRKASDSHRKNKVSNYKSYVHPVIGSKQARKVRAEDIDLCLNLMHDKGRSPATQDKVYSLLNQVFSYGEEEDLVVRNPVRRSRHKPVVPMKEALHLKPEALFSLLRITFGAPYGEAIWTQLFAGLRFGELAALHCEDIDFELGEVVVTKAFSKHENQDKPKTKGNKDRRVPVPNEVLEYLRPLVGRLGSGFLFRNTRGGRLNYKHYLSALKRYCEMAGVKEIGTHGLRHSVAGLYLKNYGAMREDLRALLGHSSSSTTERYIHSASDRLKSVATNVVILNQANHPEN